MKLFVRNYTTNNKEFNIQMFSKDSLWALYPSNGTPYDNQKKINILQNHFESSSVVFKSKKELLYNLENFQTIYNYKLLPLKHVSSTYIYHNYYIQYWHNHKHWRVKTVNNFLQHNYNTLHQNFKTRKEAVKAIDKDLVLLNNFK